MYNALGSAATAKQAAGSSEEIGESRCPNHRNCANGRIKVKRVWGKLRMCCVELEVREEGREGSLVIKRVWVDMNS